ncbi:hypothetical protein ABIC21_003365 [Pseudarthrobacter sp. PvP090]
MNLVSNPARGETENTVPAAAGTAQATAIQN